MNTKFVILVSILPIIAISISNLTCKNCPEGLVYYLPVSLTPQKDTFNIGDTLFLSINIPKELTDEQGGIRNVFEDFDFKLGTRTSRFDSVHEYSTKTLGLTSQVGSHKLYTYSFFDEYGLTTIYDGSEYRYQGVLTLKETGVFAVYFGTFYNDRLNPVKLDGNCKHEAVNLYCITNHGENNNVELVSPYNGNSTFWEEQFRLGGGFAFVVR